MGAAIDAALADDDVRFRRPSVFITSDDAVFPRSKRPIDFRVSVGGSDLAAVHAPLDAAARRNGAKRQRLILRAQRRIDQIRGAIGRAHDLKHARTSNLRTPDCRSPLLRTPHLRTDL